jgi:hypothetical protein
MTTIAEAVTADVATAIKGTATPKPSPARRPSKPVEQLVAERTAALEADWKATIKAIKAGMGTDARKVKTLEDAKRALLVCRVNIVRDTAHAMDFPESHAKAGKTAGQPSQSVVAEAVGINRLTFAPYWKAALAHKAQFGTVAGEPTEPELELVASFWAAEALRAVAKREAIKAAAAATEDAEESDGATDVRPSVAPAPESATQADVIAAVSALEVAMNLFTREQGFDKTVSEAIAEKLANIAATLESHTI